MLVFLTTFTSVDVSMDLTLHFGPEIVACDQFLSFESPGMSRKWFVMMIVDDLFMKFFVKGNIDFAMPCENSVFFFPLWVFVF